MIHQYKLNGYNIVLDVCSGSIHLVDEIAYDMIAGYETEAREALVARLAAQYADKTKYLFVNENRVGIVKSEIRGIMSIEEEAGK